MSVPAGSPQIADCYRLHSRELWATFYGLCSDPERAWEAVQESFLRLQSQAEGSIRNERAWLAHVGRNWLRDFARKRQHAEQTAESLDDVATTTLDPAGSVMRDDLRERVGTALNSLRNDDRELLLLRYALGWSSTRMSQVLGIQTAAVDMRLTRARQRLAVLLEEFGIDAETVA